MIEGDWLAAIARDAEALAVAARAAGLDATVPACPGWTVTDVLEHTGSSGAGYPLGRRAQR